VNETPTVNATPTPYLTLPSPLGNTSNLTEEPTVPWPINTTPTAYPTFTFRTTVTRSTINNTSAAVDSAGSIVGDAWLVALAAVAGVALVAGGVVVMRRNRDDWL
jgi:hypothetical protein